jgi:hypothetical protein
VADYFAAEYRNVSDHTNYQMAAASLAGCVWQLEEILASVPRGEEAVKKLGPDSSVEIVNSTAQAPSHESLEEGD